MERRIRKERVLSKIVRSPLSYLALLILLAIFSYSAINTYNKSKIAKEKTRQVEEELRKLKEQELGLSESINDMNTPFGVEKSLREKFGIIKQGEESIIIIDPPENVSESNIQEEQKAGIFGFLKSMF
ncbi:MAG: hypothetical protein QG580_423 [Patescibacteria group bacterium]|jgi:cell division protein FtsB|nr:hypothetical protein [Patescibacteria group bacterium]